MRRAAAKFVLRLLSVEQKLNRVQVCQELLDSAQSDPHFILKITTGDGSMGMILKLNISHHNRGVRSLHGPRNVDRVGLMSR